MLSKSFRGSAPFVHLGILLVLCCASSSTQTPTKLWSADLGADSDFHKRLAIDEVLLSPPSVHFLNDSQIICEFYDHEKLGFNARMKDPIFHVLEIDAQTGAFGKKLSFQSVNDRSKVLPVADGGFVVLAGQELTKFSSSFVKGTTYPTPVNQDSFVYHFWLADVSPGGKNVVLFDRNPNGMAFEWLLSDDLTLTSSLPTTLNWNFSASNNAVTNWENNQNGIESKEGTVLRSCPMCIFEFLTDDLLFVERGRKYSIETMKGEKRASGSLDGDLLDFTRAMRATRIAFLSGHYNGSGFPIVSNFHSITGKITVKDWETNKRVAEIDFGEPIGNPSDGLNQSALALSPDGKLLAVLLHHTLTVYRLP